MIGLTDTEKDLVSSVEDVIGLTHQGMSPDDAVYKVASEKQYGPPMVQRMVEAFNKSKSVHILKTAAEADRVKPFSLADADAVLRKMYMVEKIATEIPTAQVPNRMFDTIDFPEAAPVQLMEKTAAETQDIPETTDQMFRRYYNLKDACERLENRLYNDHLEARRAFDGALNRCVDFVRQMSDKQFQKVARTVYNGYPETGAKLLNIFADRTRKPLPELEKTANAVVFPQEEPYISIASCYAAADNLVRAEHSLDTFHEKKADGASVLQDYLQRAVDSTATGGGELSPERLGEILSHPFREPQASIESKLDPEFYNRIKGLGARRKFINLLLYDKDISQYDDTDVLRAYNQIVTSVPGAENNPEVLRSLMLRHLQTGGVKDVFELKAEAELGEKMLKAQSMMNDARRQQEAEIDLRKPQGTEHRPSSVHGGTSIGSKLVEGTLDTAAKLQESAAAGMEGWRKEQAEKTKEQAAKQAELDKATRQRRDDLATRIRAGLYGQNGVAINRAARALHAGGRIRHYDPNVDPRTAEDIADLMMSRKPHENFTNEEQDILHRL